MPPKEGGRLFSRNGVNPSSLLPTAVTALETVMKPAQARISSELPLWSFLY